MRRIALAAFGAAAGLVIAATPSFAYTTYELQNQGGANFASGDEQQQQDDHGFSFSAKTTTSGNPYDPMGAANFGYSQTDQQPSRDMNWQGTGYYLRPSH